jgi:hypothetical protein
VTKRAAAPHRYISGGHGELSRLAATRAVRGG